MIHGKAPEGLTCKVTWDDIDDDNYCEYQTVPSGEWNCAYFSSDTIEHMINSQYAKYLQDVEAAAKDCAAAVRRLVEMGPPMYLSDRVGLPLPEGDTHIDKVWFSSNDKETSARLVGSLQGEERETLWNSQKETLAAMEAAEKTIS